MKKFFLFVCISWSPTLVLAENRIPEKINLIFEDRTVVLDFEQNPEFIQNEARHYLTVKGKDFPIDLKGLLPKDVPYLKVKTVFNPEVYPSRIFDFLDTQFYSSAFKSPTVTISLTEQEQILFEGRPEIGFHVDEIKTLQLINEAIKNGTTNIRVPSRKIYSKAVIPEALENQGIKEVISIGESNFAGSPETRKQNIRAAAKKYHGKIIPQGETFSFNHVLDRVDKEDGFTRELVIKGNALSKEYGGGVCQVSTTTFRAAFQAGLPIVDRRNHSYDVPYYKPVGLDATIYLGGQDLRFTNDTPGDILIQTYSQGDSLFFVFYGTQDGRRVALEGPFISEVKKAPKKPIIIYTNDLPAGVTSVVSTAHEGMKTKWIRKITRKDELRSETFASYYKPWPEQILKGIGDQAVTPKVNKKEEAIVAETVQIAENAIKTMEAVAEETPVETQRKIRTFGERKYGRSPHIASESKKSARKNAASRRRR